MQAPRHGQRRVRRLSRIVHRAGTNHRGNTAARHGEGTGRSHSARNHRRGLVASIPTVLAAPQRGLSGRSATVDTVLAAPQRGPAQAGTRVAGPLMGPASQGGRQAVLAAPQRGPSNRNASRSRRASARLLGPRRGRSRRPTHGSALQPECDSSRRAAARPLKAKRGPFSPPPQEPASSKPRTRAVLATLQRGPPIGTRQFSPARSRTGLLGRLLAARSLMQPVVRLSAVGPTLRGAGKCQRPSEIDQFSTTSRCVGPAPMFFA